ncbi:MAG TPA: alkaline phosphatase family protein [Vicinamibacterales bacterium]|nr:alkaline phosphatase family protein [Vicinamibacterales bacterium]
MPRRFRALWPALLGLLVFAACAATAPGGRPTPGTTSATTTPSRTQWLNMFARGYFPGRSGQIFYVPREGDFVVDPNPLYAFMHGSPWRYDAHVPLLFHGPGIIRQGSWSTPVAQQDVAPTLAAILGIAPPATTTGRILQEALLASRGQPRIIALFVLDGMRVDYFDTHADVMPTLTRLGREGAWFADARVTSMPTLTSVGHATLGTGTDPRVHGLVVNNLFNRVTGKSQESYDGLDPGELMALTLADVWNLATDGRAIIIGQGGAIRATAGLVGHGACLINGRKVLAASYSTRDGGWETNDRCYEMPAALARLNGKQFWEQAGGMWMGHDIASPSRFRASAVFQRFEGDAIAAVLESADLGSDAITDLVLINVKSPDWVSHAYGPSSREMRETLAELDRQLSRAVQIIVRKAGPNGSVVAISADHGMPGEPTGQARRITIAEIVAALNERFTPKGASIIHYFGDPANAQIHLDTARITELGFSLKDVAEFLESRFFAAVFTEEEVRNAQARLPLGK